MLKLNKLIGIVLACFIALSTLNAEKFGLIIAIGDYPEEGMWPDISAKNDIIHVRSAMHSLGIIEDNIMVISDENATKDAITEAFKMLNQKLAQGDFVYIHYSGHGQQVMDDNGDEIDNLDEAIVPYNSPLEFVEGFNEGQYLIRDDELGVLTRSIRKSCGTDGQVLLILDSCHSGSGTRGMGKARGTNKIMAPENFKSLAVKKERHMGIASSDIEGLAPMASFFGSSANELNYETIDDQLNPVGSLSFAMSSILSNVQNNYSFEELYAKLRMKMKKLAPHQSPVWEGPAQLSLFGDIKKKDPNFDIIKQISPNELKINAGTINEVFKDSEFEIYSVDNSTAICKGLVYDSQLLNSTLILDKNITTNENNLIRAKLVHKTAPPVTCALNIDFEDENKWKELIKFIELNPLVKQQDENPDLILTSCNENNDVQLMAKDGTILLLEEGADPKSAGLKSSVLKYIRGFQQANFLRSYDNPVSSFDFDLEIIQLNCKTEKPIGTINGQSNTELKFGDCIQIRVKNIGNKRAYFTLLDIQSNDAIQLLIPAVELGYTAEEYVLDPGESYTTDYIIELGEPAGEETLKLISSKEPLNVSAIMQTQGMASRGVAGADPFEMLFASSYGNVQTRGIKIKSKNTDAAGTTTVYLNVSKN